MDFDFVNYSKRSLLLFVTVANIIGWMANIIGWMANIIGWMAIIAVVSVVYLAIEWVTA